MAPPKMIPVDYDPFASDSPAVPQLIWGASKGRMGDTLLGHLTAGDVVIPSERVTPQVATVLGQLLGQDRNRFTVGTSDNSINPATGLREFGEDTGGGNDGNGNSGGSEGGSGSGNGGAGGTGNEGDGGGYGIDPGQSSYNPNTTSVSFDDQQSATATVDTPGPPEAPANTQAFANTAPTQVAFDDIQTASPTVDQATNTRGFMDVTGIGSVDRAINKAIDNPVATIANFGFGFVPGVGQINSAIGTINSIAGTSFGTFGSSLAAIGNSIANGTGVGVSGDAGGGDSSGRGGSAEDNASTYYENVTRPNEEDAERLDKLASLGFNAPAAPLINNQKNTPQATGSSAVTNTPAAVTGYLNPVHSLQSFLDTNPFTNASFVSGVDKWL